MSSPRQQRHPLERLLLSVLVLFVATRYGATAAASDPEATSAQEYWIKRALRLHRTLPEEDQDWAKFLICTTAVSCGDDATVERLVRDQNRSDSDRITGTAALALLDHGHVQKALHILKAVDGEVPKNVRMRFARYAGRASPAKALAAYPTDGDPVAQARLRIGALQGYAMAGEVEAARSILEQLGRSDKTAVSGDHLATAREWVEASVLAYKDDVDKADGVSERVRSKLTRVLIARFSRGDVVAGEARIGHLTNTMRRAQAHLALALGLQLRGELDDAEKALAKAEAELASSTRVIPLAKATGYGVLAELQARAGRARECKEALRALQAVVDGEVDGMGPMFGMIAPSQCRALLLIGESDEAVSFARKNADDGEFQHLRTVIRWFVARNRWREAIALREAYEDRPGSFVLDLAIAEGLAGVRGPGISEALNMMGVWQ